MIKTLNATLLCLAFAAAPVLAQDAAPAASAATTPALTLELNALQAVETGCRVSFLATNTLGSQLDRAAVEVAFFDGSGGIDRIVTLDFKNLPEGKTKVLQFQLGELPCDNISRLLINDITACEGPDLAADACLAGLTTSARPDITFGS